MWGAVLSTREVYADELAADVSLAGSNRSGFRYAAFYSKSVTIAPTRAKPPTSRRFLGEKRPRLAGETAGPSGGQVTSAHEIVAAWRR